MMTGVREHDNVASDSMKGGGNILLSICSSCGLMVAVDFCLLSDFQLFKNDVVPLRIFK